MNSPRKMISRPMLAFAVGCACGPAYGQLGSFNHERESPAAAEVPALAEDVSPVLANIEVPFEIRNAEAAWPISITKTFENLFVLIPDNSSVGVAHAPVVSGVPGVIQSLQVQVNLSPAGASPMFNGDIFATLSHSSGYSVLLNRAGRRDGSTTGYGDNGFNLTFSMAATADIHSYRTTVSGNELTPISAADPALPLTGTWQPDGRTADPEAVLTSSPRITSLETFTGMDPNGEWTLFVADFGAGGIAQLESWSLEFTVVPEPSTTAMVTGTGLLGLAMARRWRQSRRRPTSAPVVLRPKG